MRLAAAIPALSAILLMVLHFTKGDPSIKEFIPPYGPLKGGTQVSVTLLDARDYNAVSIQLANVNCRIIENEHSGDELVVSCESGETSILVDEVVTVTLLHKTDGLRFVARSDTHFFYKPNPLLYKVENNAVIRSGGIKVWVTGVNLLSVMAPVMVIQRLYEGEIMRFTAPCQAVNNTKMSCISPSLQMPTTPISTIETTPPTKPMLQTTPYIAPGTPVPSEPTEPPAPPILSPSPQSTLTSTIEYTKSQATRGSTSPINFSRTTLPNFVRQGLGTTKIIIQKRRRRQAVDTEDDEPEFFAGFELDGIRYPNFSRILVYDDPVFHKFEDKDQTRTFFPLQETELVIKGKSLSLALQAHDILVFVGKGNCKVVSLITNQLTCTPPPEEPELDSGQDKHRVVVEAGETLVYFVGYLRYGELEGKIPKLLMLILIGVGVLFFWILVFGLICYITRRKKKMRSRHSTAGSNNSTGQTYLTDNYGSDTDSQGVPFMGTMFNTDPLDILPAELRHRVIQCRMDSNRLHVGQCIGTGTYGRVFRGTLLNSDEDGSFTVAVKTLKRVGVYYEREMTDFLQEALVMKDLRHPNIIHLYGVVIFNYAPFVVFEYMDLGDLRTYIKNNKNIPLKSMLTFALQIAHALTYLTSQNFVHMDVAARNCLINNKMQVKLGDFGLARDLHGLDYYKLADRAKPMPVKWMALESLQWGRFTSHSDVWSFGVLLWELLTRGQRPYEAVDNMDIKAHIAAGHRLHMPRLGDSNLYNIMTLTWREDPSSRPTFEELVIKLQEALSRIQ